MMGIYKITNLINGKCYIGQSINITERWREHRTRYHQPSFKQFNCPLYRAMRKYELKNFSFEVIEDCSYLEDENEYRKELNKREKFWITYYKSNISDFGYNLTEGGDAQSERYKKLSEEQILEIKSMLISGITQANIANKYGVSQTVISYINLGKEYYHEEWSYPIVNKIKKKYCIDCGTELKDRNSIRCLDCYKKMKEKDISHIPLSREELKERIRKESFYKIAKDFNKTDNAIRRWCRKLKLPSTRSEINKISNEDWLLIELKVCIIYELKTTVQQSTFSCDQLQACGSTPTLIRRRSPKACRENLKGVKFNGS